MRKMQNVDRHPKSGIYRVRVTFPGHLFDLLGAKSYTSSLATKDALAAKKLALPVLARLQRRVCDAEAVHRARSTGTTAEISLSLEVGLMLVEDWRDNYLRRLARVMAGSSEVCGNYLAIGDSPEKDWALLDPMTLVSLYYSATSVPGDVIERTLDRLLLTAGYVLPQRHRLRSTLIDVLRQTIKTIRARHQEWKAGIWTVMPPPPRITSTSSNDVTDLTCRPATSPQPTVTPRMKSISALLEAWMQHSKPKAQKEPQLAVKQLIDCLKGGDVFVHQVSFEDAEKFYEVLRWLPSSMTLAMRMQPIAKIASDMRAGELDRPRAAGATAAKKIQLLSTMFNLAVARGWTSINPFARLVGKHDAKPKTKRRPMRDEDVHSVFSAPLFAGCDGFDTWREPGSYLVANHRFWIPLLALVTGMRIEEVGQLLVSDVREEDGILYLLITEEVADEDDEYEPTLTGAKSVKTSTSVRRVPLHQIALDAGFAEYWRWASASRHGLLFPELPADGKRTKNASRWFNRDFRPTVGLTDRNRTFHSFRHLFKDRCRAAKLRTDLHNALTGHADSSAGAKYGDGLGLDDLKSGIDLLTFPGWPGVPSRKGPFALCSRIGATIQVEDFRRQDGGATLQAEAGT